jgi:NADP-dependent 3-hydroxy acid dehydrogenase YdfG
MIASRSPANRAPVALVTGASSGIGRAVALRLARAGHRVAVCARRADRLVALADELRAAGASEVVQRPVDLRREDEILALFAEIREQLGGVDVLINNAGLGYHATLLDGDTAAWRETLEVNVLALCICTREAVRDMRARDGRGHIVHVSSMAGHRVPPASGVYAASKFAVRALTEALRRELWAAGTAIRVSAISPGFVETEFAARFHGSEEAAHATYHAFPVLQPAEIAEAVWYILSQPEHVQVHDLLVRPLRQEY